MGGEKGGSDGASGYVCFCQQRAPRAKQVLCDARDCSSPKTGTGQRAVNSLCVYLLQFVLSMAMFSDVLSHAEVRYSKCIPNNCCLLLPYVENQFLKDLGVNYP